jgi:hypothetical protein
MTPSDHPPRPQKRVVHEDEGADCFFEEFAYVADGVYEERTGQWPPAPPDDDSEEESDGKPGGEPWEEVGDDLQRRFPRLWKKFAGKWMG